MPETAMLYVEDLPSYRVKLGRQNEKMALKIDTQLKRPDTVKSDLEMVVSSRRTIPGEE
jgi:flagellar motor switch protein FliM